MALIWVTGFEHGRAALSTNGGGMINVATGSTISVQSTTKRTGTYALQLNKSAAADCRIEKDVAGSNVIVGAVWIRFATFPSTADDDLVYGVVSAGVNLGLKLNITTKKVYARFWGTADGSTADLALSLDTWYRLDYKFDVSTGTSKIDFQVTPDGGSATAATQSTLSQTATSFTNAGIGSTNTNTSNMFVDDVVIASSGYPLGNVAVQGLRPSGDGTHNAGVNVMEDSAGNDINGTTFVAASYLDDDPWGTSFNTDYVRQTQNGTGNYCEVLFADTSFTTILGAMFLLQYASATTTSNTGACICINEDATETTVWGSPSVLADYSENTPFYKSVILPDPAGGWDLGAVNALKARFGYSNDANPDPYWLAMIIEVAYIPGTQYTSSPTGTVTSSGVLVKQDQPKVIGTVTSSGVANKQTAHSFTSAVTSVGVVLKQAALSFTGSISSSSILSGAKITMLNLLGTVASSGVLARQVGKDLVASLASTGEVLKQAATSFVGAVGSSSVVTASRTVVANFVGTISSGGVLIKQVAVNLVGTVTSSSALVTVHTFVTALVGTLTSAGDLVKQTATSLAGAVGSSSTLSGIKTTLVSVVGAVSSSGSLTNQAAKLLDGATASVGALVKQVSTNMSGAVTSSGVVASIKTLLVSLTGAVTSSGVLIKQSAVSFVGELSSTGLLAKQAFKNLAGAISGAGDATGEIISGAFEISLDGVVTVSGVLSRSISKELSSAVASVGSITKGIGKFLTGILTSLGIVTTPTESIVVLETNLSVTQQVVHTLSTLGGVSESLSTSALISFELEIWDE